MLNHCQNPILAGPAEVFSPQLDTKETTVQSDDLPTYRDFLISGNRRTIDLTRSLYVDHDHLCGTNLTQSYDACRTFAWFVQHKKTGHVRVASARCNLRWCPLCIRTKRTLLVNSSGAWIKSLDRPKFLTFTLKHFSGPLDGQIDGLYKAFRELRRQPFIRRHLRGGIWFFQITKSKSDGCWHPHLHVLADCGYIDKFKLSSAWRTASHGSRIVDIRQVRDAKKAADYVARYASAPCRLDDFSRADALEIMTALKGRRIVGAWGTAKGVQLSPRRSDDADDWIRIDFFSVVHRNAPYDLVSRRVLTAWQEDEPMEIIVTEPPPEPPPLPPIELVAEQYIQGWLDFYK
ncbi:MAG: protein rep [Kiritimatiellae bacterium]|nr:protein rep [Kiritimatiellia bacterium]